MRHIKSWLTLLFTATFVLSPALTSPFSGFRADQLPIPQIDPPLQPAGWAFSIWGLIYGWLIVSAVFGVWKRRNDAAWDSVRTPLIGSLVAGTPWLWVANQSAIWATVLIFVMAVLAIAALWRLPAKDHWWLTAPVGLYAGWLTAASFVSLGSTAAGYGVLTDATGWAYLGIALALVAAALTQKTASRAPEYGLAVIWALIGIAAANASGQLAISVMALSGVVVLVALMIWQRARPPVASLP